MKKQDDKVRERDAGVQISPEGLLNNWKRISQERVRGGWVTLTRSSNHPCETQSALLCLGNSVEFVVKVVNVNLGIQTNLPRPTRTPLSLRTLSAFLDGGLGTRATLLRKCWLMFANPLLVRVTRVSFSRSF